MDRKRNTDEQSDKWKKRTMLEESIAVFDRRKADEVEKYAEVREMAERRNWGRE